MRPVVEFLKAQGLKAADVAGVVIGHPPVLSYSVEGRLAPLFEFLRSDVGVADAGAAVARRPSLLGLELSGLEKIVGYLKSVDTPPETIITYVERSI